MIPVHRAEQKRAEFMGAAELEELAGMRQLAHGVLHLLEAAVKPGLQLRQRHMSHVAFIKNGEWQAKLRPKLFETHFGAVGLRQHIVRRPPNCRQVVHQRARPVEDDVPNHWLSVVRFLATAMGETRDVKRKTRNVKLSNS